MRKKPINVALAFEMGMDAFEFNISLRLNILGEKLSLQHHQRPCVSTYEGTMDAEKQNVYGNNVSSNLSNHYSFNT